MITKHYEHHFENELSANLRNRLYDRRAVVVARWVQSLASAHFMPRGRNCPTQRLLPLLNDIIDTICSMHFDAQSAYMLGGRLSSEGFAFPAALGVTQHILAEELMAQLPNTYIAFLQPRLTMFLSRFATGFTEQLSNTILTEHKQICTALFEERAKLFNHLRMTEHQLRIIFTNSPIVLCMFDSAGIVRFIEGKPLKQLGVEPGTLIGQSMFSIAAPFPLLIQYIRAALNGETGVATVEVDSCQLEAYYAPVADADGVVKGVLKITVNDTHQTCREIQLHNVTTLPQPSRVPSGDAERGMHKWQGRSSVLAEPAQQPQSHLSHAPRDTNVLSPREREILQSVADGMTNSEIAVALGLARSTVKWYLDQVYAKLGVKNRTSAVMYARTMGILPDTRAVVPDSVDTRR